MARQAGFELGGGAKRLYIAQPADHWVPTGAALVHQISQVECIGIASRDRNTRVRGIQARTDVDRGRPGKSALALFLADLFVADHQGGCGHSWNRVSRSSCVTAIGRTIRYAPSEDTSRPSVPFHSNSRLNGHRRNGEFASPRCRSHSVKRQCTPVHPPDRTRRR